MEAFSFKEPWVKGYVERLLGLSTATKKAIIRALEHSMGRPGPESGEDLSDRFWRTFGAWDDPRSAEELARSIRAARHDRDRPVDL